MPRVPLPSLAHPGTVSLRLVFSCPSKDYKIDFSVAELANVYYIAGNLRYDDFLECLDITHWNRPLPHMLSLTLFLI